MPTEMVGMILMDVAIIILLVIAFMGLSARYDPRPRYGRVVHPKTGPKDTPPQPRPRNRGDNTTGPNTSVTGPPPRREPDDEPRAECNENRRIKIIDNADFIGPFNTKGATTGRFPIVSHCDEKGKIVLTSGRPREFHIGFGYRKPITVDECDGCGWYGDLYYDHSGGVRCRECIKKQGVPK